MRFLIGGTFSHKISMYFPSCTFLLYVLSVTNSIKHFCVFGMSVKYFRKSVNLECGRGNANLKVLSGNGTIDEMSMKLPIVQF